MDFKPRLGSCSLISHPILEYPEIGYSPDYTRFFSDAHVRPRWQQETTGPSVSGVALHRKLTVMQLHCPFLVRWFRAAFVLAVLHL